MRAGVRLRLASAAALLCGAALGGCGAAGSGGSLTVLGTWTDTEQTAFERVLHGFTAETGIRVGYTGTRDADAVLASELQNGDPPDLAVLATPGELRQYAAAGRLHPLDGAMDPGQYPSDVRGLTVAAGRQHDAHMYGIIVKASLKGLIWYDPARLPAGVAARLTAPGLTWPGLTALTAGLAANGGHPWCVGMADTSTSGWPGTDWIEDLLLHQAGPQAYDGWVAGTLPWTDARVRAAWQALGGVLAAGGDPGTALTTGFGQAGAPLFAAPPGCYLDHEGSFITGYYARVRAGGAAPRPVTDYDFVPFPSAGSPGQGAEEIAGDLLGMFRDSPAARRLAHYLTTPAAQRIWIDASGGGMLSLNRQVPLSAYHDTLSRRIADRLTHAATVRFDGSDSMPHVMSAAFENAVLEYTADPTPARLDMLLKTLEVIRTAAY